LAKTSAVNSAKAIIPPLNNVIIRSFTNATNLQLLKVRTNDGRDPIKYYTGYGDRVLVPLPVDHTLSDTIRSDPNTKTMMAGLNFGPAHI
jgi:hypothetical protein